MTVEEEIKHVNTAFQKAYYDTDAGFFDILIPQWLTEAKAMIEKFIQKNPVLKDNFNDSLQILDTELEETAGLLGIPNPSDAVKDNYLIAMKRNVSQALWRFRDRIYMYDARLLHQQSDPAQRKVA